MGDKSFDSQLAQAGLSTFAKSVRKPSMGSSDVPLDEDMIIFGCLSSTALTCWFDGLMRQSSPLIGLTIVSCCCRYFSDDSAMTDVVDVLANDGSQYAVCLRR